MKTVTAVFKDVGFKPGEFERLQKMIILKLREVLPNVIVRVERNKVAWDSVTTRVSGYWEEDSEPVLRQAHPIIMEIWRQSEWREGFKSPPRLVGVVVPVATSVPEELSSEGASLVENPSETKQGELDGKHA
jgi:hypothetical protein